MPSVDVTCPSCKKQHSFGDLLPFRAECDACAADLHVCLSCRHYDRYVENSCREDQADPVAAKDRRNLCEYWKPIPLGGAPADDAAAVAKAKLAALFGDGPPPATSAPAVSTAADEAKRKLEELFRKK